MFIFNILMITSYFTGYSLLRVTEVVQMLVFQGFSNMAELHRWLITQPDTASQPFVHVLTLRFYYTHIYILFLLKYLTTYSKWTLVLRKWFCSFIKKLKLSIGLYQPRDFHLWCIIQVVYIQAQSYQQSCTAIWTKYLLLCKTINTITALKLQTNNVNNNVNKY